MQDGVSRADRKQSVSGGFVGALIGLNELDPEVLKMLKGLKVDVDGLKEETDSLRHLYRAMKGLSKEQVDKDLLLMRTEVR